jgi:hypothetical protein
LSFYKSTSICYVSCLPSAKVGSFLKAVFLYEFSIVQKLPRFFGSTILAQLVIFLYAILLCLTSYCSENISTFMSHYMCIVLSIIAWVPLLIPYSFQIPSLNHAVPFLPFTLQHCIHSSFGHCRFIFQCETEYSYVFSVILSVFVYHCTSGMIIYKL